VTSRAARPSSVAWGSVAFALVATALLAAPEARTHETRSAWPYRTLIARIDGKRVRLPDRRIRVNRDLVICSGEGTSIRRGGVRRWKHFTCTQTLFRRGVDRDITFRVHVLDRTHCLITNARYGPD
jgi:hypothetical protein